MASRAARILWIAAAMGAGLAAQTPAASLRSLGQTAEDFAETARINDTRYAYLFYLLPDAVGFEPEPVPLYEMWQQRIPPKSKLTIIATRAEMNEAGDLGFTLGPWVQENRGSGTKSTGYFATIWKHSVPDGWRIAVQVGTTAPPPEKSPRALKVRSLSNREPMAPAVKAIESSKAGIERCDDAYATAIASRGYAAAFREVAARDAVTLMLAQPLIDTIDAGAQVRADFTRPGTWKRENTGVGGSPDFGFTYGSIVLDAPQSYVRIWRVAKDRCELQLEWLRPRP